MHPPAHPHRTRSLATTRCHHLRTPDSNDPFQSVWLKTPSSPLPTVLAHLRHHRAHTHITAALYPAHRGEGNKKGLPETTSERPSSTLYI
ncbi:hypothetical protein PsW64_00299 [Pseudovibrio sp. W64]|nr:hypothetical protein PsW64_00299 [Pseudovibrio sp. W64]